jgi:predicted nucleic acid-binding protein
LLRAWLDGRVIAGFGTRILPVDTAVGGRSARLDVPDPRPFRDALIAATALVHGITVATRNVTDFEPTGVPLVNPWTVE